MAACRRKRAAPLAVRALTIQSRSVSPPDIGRSLRILAENLIRPFAEGRALPENFRLEEWDVEQGITMVFRGRDGALSVELEAADASRSCWATTRRFNVYYDTIDRSRPLSQRERELLETVVRVLREQEETLPVPPPPVAPASRRASVREVEVERALVRDGPNRYYLNPYI